MQKTTRLHRSVVAAAMVLVMSGCGNSRSFSHVASGAAVAGDDWWFLSGGTFLQPNEPGVLFGMQKTPDGDREFAYVVIFRHNLSSADAIFSYSRPKSAGVSFDGEIASITDGVTIDGIGTRLEMQLEADKAAGTVQATHLTINGEDVDPSKGALFLVDLTSRPVAYKQVDAKLAGNLPEPKEKATVKQLARQITQQLKGENDIVKAFLTN